MLLPILQLIVSIVLFGFVQAWDAPIVKLPYATYRGSYNETTGLNSFLGIVSRSLRFLG